MMARPASRGGGHAGRAYRSPERNQFNELPAGPVLAGLARRSLIGRQNLCPSSSLGKGLLDLSADSPTSRLGVLWISHCQPGRPFPSFTACDGTTRRECAGGSGSPPVLVIRRHQLVVQQALQRRHGRPAALTVASHIARVSGGQSLAQPVHEPRDNHADWLESISAHVHVPSIVAVAVSSARTARFGSTANAAAFVATNMERRHGQKVPHGVSNSVRG